MSYNERWCTKADILKDLAEVTGRLVDVDERYIFKGKEPPPVRILEDDDNEINLRFGKHLYEEDYVMPKPDLKGISQMLRMVNGFDGQEDGVEDEPLGGSDHIVISKLNPEVPDFVPKGAARVRETHPSVPEASPETIPKGPASHNEKPTNNSDDLVINNNNLSKASNFNNDKSNVNNLKMSKDTKKQNGMKKDDVKKVTANKPFENDKEQKCYTDYLIKKRIDISELNADEIRDIASKLRSKISDSSKRDNLQSKREKNVAIATLLKLYSATPPQANSPQLENFDGDNDSDDNDKDKKPIKLITPEYFETLPKQPNLGANEVICEVHGVIVDIASDSTAPKESISKDTKVTSKISKKSIETGEIPSLKDSKGSANSNQCIDRKNKSSTPNLDEGSPIRNKHTKVREVQNSIDKVNKWFEKPESPKPRGLNVCLGPVAFRRKTPVAISPVSDAAASDHSTATSSGPSNTSQIGHYKPSKYAEDLSKKFMERGKALEKQKLDLWQLAEIQMKEREQLMNKKVKQTATSQDSVCDNTDNS